MGNLVECFTGVLVPVSEIDRYVQCNRLSLLLLRTAYATYLLTLPPEVPPILSISCVLILVAVLSLSTSAANWVIYSSCFL